MIERTQAIALRIAPFSRTSHVVIWLTPHHGRLVTVIKGAMRPKSFFLGQYDLFQTCDLLYYERGREGPRIARECGPVRLRSAFRENWRAAALASYVASLAERISVHRERPDPLFSPVSDALDLLAERGADALPVVFWLELRLLRVLGFDPRLDICVRCSAPADSAGSHVLSVPGGGLLCVSCSSSDPKALPLPADCLRILHEWRLGAPRDAVATALTDNQRATLRTLLGVFLGHHLDLHPRTRTIAFDLAEA